MVRVERPAPVRVSMNEVWLAGKFSTRSFRREVSEAMRGGDVGSQAEVTEAEMEAMIDMILGSYLSISHCCPVSRL